MTVFRHDKINGGRKVCTNNNMKTIGYGVQPCSDKIELKRLLRLTPALKTPFKDACKRAEVHRDFTREKGKSYC